MGYIRLEKDSDGIIDFIFDQPGKTVNTMGVDYQQAMDEAMLEVKNQIAAGGVTGIYVKSGKPKQFFAGGDIKDMLEMDLNVDVAEKARIYDGLMETKQPLRDLELLGVPVAVGINGPAMGGGFEIALSCHHRIALEGVAMGLPEAQIGLMPGAGGTVRLTRLLGMQKAMPLIAQGKRLTAAKALEKGIIHDTAENEAQMADKAKAWIKANPEAKQPWDTEGYQIPGGLPDDAANQGFIFFGPAATMGQTKNLMPAQNAIYSCIVDSARVDFDTAQKIEGRYMLSLLLDQTARNMMTTFFLQMEALNRGANRPDSIERTQFKKIGILGAGQMGAGIATMAAQKGIQVVIKDINQENANKGKDYAAKVYEKNKRVDEAQAEEFLARICASDNYAELADCELIIEAVFEDRGIKAIVTKETEAVIADNAVFASNTSALPISELAQASVRAENYIGMHFFSPAEKMPLVEIICGENTADITLAKAFDLAQQLGKTPIVVNDGPGFFTSRTIATTISQGAEMVTEGINPVLIESAARDNGAPVGPLAAIDEISQQTAYKNGLQAKEDAIAQGKTWEESPVSQLIDRMVNEFDRKGKLHGAGYYEYPEGKKKHIWSGLAKAYASDGFTEIPYQDIKDRLWFCQSLEAVRCLEEGILRSVGDANIGSIMGIGFAAQTGGVLQAINAYGLSDFLDRSRVLAKQYGVAFEPPQLLIDRVNSGELFQ